MHGFVIYGKSGSEAEYYATASDPDNDYENHFTFIASDLTETQPETAQETPEEPEVMTVTETNAEGEVIIEEVTLPTADTTEAGLSGILGAELKNNTFLQILLATLGGIAVVLALTLAILASKKPKKNNANHEKDDES